MSTTIITQFSQNENTTTTTTDTQNNTNRTLSAIIQDENIIFVSDPITHNDEGKSRFTDYQIKVKSSSILVKKLNLDVTKSVRRRYRDFEWLYNELNSLRINLPELPGKQLKIPGFQKYLNKNFETEFIEKRCKLLEKFLNKLCQNPFVQTNRSFYQFLQDDTLNK